MLCKVCKNIIKQLEILDKCKCDSKIKSNVYLIFPNEIVNYMTYTIRTI